MFLKRKINAIISHFKFYSSNVLSFNCFYNMWSVKILSNKHVIKLRKADSLKLVLHLNRANTRIPPKIFQPISTNLKIKILIINFKSTNLPSTVLIAKIAPQCRRQHHSGKYANGDHCLLKFVNIP